MCEDCGAAGPLKRGRCAACYMRGWRQRERVEAEWWGDQWQAVVAQWWTEHMRTRRGRAWRTRVLGEARAKGYDAPPTVVTVAVPVAVLAEPKRHPQTRRRTDEQDG